MTNNKRKKRNPSINLSEIGIKPGAKLRFVPASEVYTDIFVTVVDNNNIGSRIIGVDYFGNNMVLYIIL